MDDNSTHTDSTPSWFPDENVDEATAICHARFEPTLDAVVVAIVEAVATATNEDVTDLPPLFEAIDGEALTKLMTTAQSRRRHVEVSFPYQDCHVIVSSRGDVVVLAAVD